MFPAEFDLARTLIADRERDAARHNAGNRAARRSSMTSHTRQAVGTALVTLGNRLIPSTAESPPRPFPASNC